LRDGRAAAGHRLEAHHLVEAALRAADAADDVVGELAGGLARQVGVRDQRAAEADGVGQPIGEDALGDPRVIDAVGGEDGDVHALADAAGEVGVRALGHGGDDLRHPRLVPPAGNADVVHAVAFEQCGELRGLPIRVAAGHEVVAGDAHADDRLVSDRRADRSDHLAAEARPLGQRGAAVLVVALVGHGGEELGGQVARRGDDLHDVESGLGGADGRLGVVADDGADLLDGHRAGRFPGVARGHGGRGESRLAADQERVHVATGVEQLHAGQRPGTANGPGEATHSGNEAVLAQRDEERAAGVLVDGAGADDDQAGAAPGPRGVEVDQLRRDLALRRVGHVHRRHDDAVANLAAAELERSEQALVHAGLPRTATPGRRRPSRTIPLRHSGRPAGPVNTHGRRATEDDVAARR
jgi:hypothetical protein